MKVVLEYDSATGELKDNDGASITTWHGLEDEHALDTSTAKAGTGTSTLIKLKSEGFTADEIIQLNREGII